ncbi:LacI family DNA-binding transcriptional regulator [Agromyces mangrovi Wang et al. 2018]|uniref:LacI family DNA-binding transcriptional regulator n=1 Tax=Agromyces mangrovi TaxID=1858653 RepID=UPI002572618A|nr:LacI family DNA-binding transcriptional regulator [Agromyces mangrovi]BDZ65307.1 LacI family transcriptional regulator [Agromyces mangrovi]
MPAARTTTRRPSMADVARLAGVSTQTVSRYFTGTGYVGDDTRERVAEAIDELGYRRNLSARNLRAARTDTIGVLTMGALNYGAASVLTGLSLAAREAEVTLSISQLDLDFEAIGWEAEARRALDHFLSIPVDGIIVSTPIRDADAMLGDIEQSTPVVVVSERPILPEHAATMHSYTAGHQATRHLIELGHRRILHVAGPGTRNEAQAREQGYRDALAEDALEPLVAGDATDWNAGSGHRAGLAADPDAFTAVFAANDELALGFMSAMDRRGIRAPGDYSIVGVDDMPSAAFFSPPLTTMRLDFRELGVQTFRMLHQEIVTGEKPHHFVLEPELIVRESTRPPA